MSDLSQWDVLVRVLVAGGLGAVIGLERERHRRAAGVRTHALVAIGSALLTASTALYLADGGRTAAGDLVRIAAGIVTGVGFIGAGTIIMSEGRVRGLTTAATIWVTSAIGITAGYGFLLLAALVAGPVTLTILLLGVAERRLEQLAEGAGAAAARVTGPAGGAGESVPGDAGNTAPDAGSRTGGDEGRPTAAGGAADPGVQRRP